MLAGPSFLALICFFSATTVFAAPNHHALDANQPIQNNEVVKVSKRGFFGNLFNRKGEYQTVKNQEIKLNPARFKPEIDLLRRKELDKAGINSLASFLMGFNACFRNQYIPDIFNDMTKVTSESEKTMSNIVKVDYVIYRWDQLSKQRPITVESESAILKLQGEFERVQDMILSFPDKQKKVGDVAAPFTKAGLQLDIMEGEEPGPLPKFWALKVPATGSASDMTFALRLHNVEHEILETFLQFNKYSSSSRKLDLNDREVEPNRLSLWKEMADSLDDLVEPNGVAEVRKQRETALKQAIEITNLRSSSRKKNQA